MGESSKNTPLTIPETKPDEYRYEIKNLLKNIGDKCYINNISSKPSPIKRPILTKEEKK